MTCRALTATHPTPDGGVLHVARARIVALSASLRASGVRCSLSVVALPARECPFLGSRWHGASCPQCEGRGVLDAVPTALEVSWGPTGHGSRGGRVRLAAVDPAVSSGTRGSVVDLLPVEGMPASRPLPRHDGTRVVSLASARRAPYLGHGDAWSECPEITPAEWAAREREAARLLDA